MSSTIILLSLSLLPLQAQADPMLGNFFQNMFGGGSIAGDANTPGSTAGTNAGAGTGNWQGLINSFLKGHNHADHAGLLSGSGSDAGHAGHNHGNIADIVGSFLNRNRAGAGASSVPAAADSASANLPAAASESTSTNPTAADSASTNTSSSYADNVSTSRKCSSGRRRKRCKPSSSTSSGTSGSSSYTPVSSVPIQPNPRPLYQPQYQPQYQPATSSPSTNQPQYQQPSQTVAGQDTPCLQLHNQARQSVNLPPLSWSSTLASSSQAYAQTLQSSSPFALSLHHSKSGGAYGENLYAYSAGGTCVAATRDWVAEGRPMGFGGYNHYSQIVYPKTRQVGCGSVGMYTVCRYDVVQGM